MTINHGHIFGEMEVLDFTNRITHCVSNKSTKILILSSSIFLK